MMRFVGILTLILANGIQPLLEVLLLPDLFLRRYHELLWWRLMHIEVFGFDDDDGLTAVRPNSAVGADMTDRVATGPDSAIGPDMSSAIGVGGRGTGGSSDSRAGRRAAGLLHVSAQALAVRINRRCLSVMDREVIESSSKRRGLKRGPGP